MQKKTITMQFLNENLPAHLVKKVLHWAEMHRTQPATLDLDEDLKLRDRVFDLFEPYIDPKDTEPYNAMLDILCILETGPAEVEVFCDPTRTITLDIPHSKLKQMKKWLEETGHYKYIIYNPAAFYRDMLMFKIINGFETEIDWEDTLSMEPFEKNGDCVKIGPRTEPGIWQHPDYTGLSDNANKLLKLIRDEIRQSEEIFGEPTNLVDCDMLLLRSGPGINFKEGIAELTKAGRIKQTETRAYYEVEVMPTLK